MYNKKYVEVTAKYLENGNIIPLVIHYDNNINYKIDKVKSCKPRASLKAGGCGLRYEIEIGNNVTYLFLENNKWFVEEK